jgi:hypothetical protein
MAAALPALRPESTHLEVEAHLAALQLAGATHSIAVYPYQVTFNSKAHQVNWSKVFPDVARTNHTIQEFFLHPLGGRRHRAGLFLSDTETWVGVPYNPERPYHAWAGVVAAWPDRLGKRILIWDPNGRYRLANAPQGSYPYNAVTIGAQRTLVARAKDSMRVEEVWYLGEGENTEDRCLAMTVEWMARLMAEGVPDDLAAAGWVKLQG